MTTRRTGCCIAVRFEPDWPAEELPDFARWVEELGFEELWFARIPARVVDDHSGVLGQRVLHRAASPCRSARPRCAGSAAAAPAGLRGVDTLNALTRPIESRLRDAAFGEIQISSQANSD